MHPSRNILYQALLLLVLSFDAKAQLNPVAYSALSIPGHLMENADQVVRLERLEFRVKDEKEGVLYHKKVVTLLNDRNTEGELILPYDNDTRINSLQIHIYDALGRQVRKIGLKDKEIEDRAAVDGFSIYIDTRYKRFKAAHASYPFTVEYELEITAKGIQYAVYPDWEIQDFHTSVQDSRFEVEMPVRMDLHFKAFNIDMEPRTEAGKPGRKSFVWQVNDLPAIPREPYSPTAYEVLPRVITSPGAFQIASYSGSMASWNDFGAFVYKLYDGRDVLPAKTAEEVRRIVAQTPDATAKIKALYRYMQNNMRYVSVQMGIGGWQPFDAVYVAQNQYGDCKALANFMKAMLREAGIEAWPALIKSGRLDYEVTEDFVTPRFNHVILYVPETDTWLECTSAHFPPDYIGDDNSDRNVLLVTPQGGQLARTPAQGTDHNVQRNHTRIQVRADGSASLEQQSRFSGKPHERMRYLRENLSKEEQEKWLLRNTGLPAFSLRSMALEASAEAAQAGLVFEADLGQFGSRTGKRWFMPLNPLNAYSGVPPALQSRRLPVAFKQALTEEDTIRIDIPAGFALESYPRQAQELQSVFGSYSLRVEATEGGLNVYRRLSLEPALLPNDAYPEFRNFFREVAKFDGQKAVLVIDE